MCICNLKVHPFMWRGFHSQKMSFSLVFATLLFFGFVLNYYYFLHDLKICQTHSFQIVVKIYPSNLFVYKMLWEEKRKNHQNISFLLPNYIVIRIRFFLKWSKLPWCAHSRICLSINTSNNHLLASKWREALKIIFCYLY